MPFVINPTNRSYISIRISLFHWFQPSTCSLVTLYPGVKFRPIALSCVEGNTIWSPEPHVMELDQVSKHINLLHYSFTEAHTQFVLNYIRSVDLIGNLICPFASCKYRRSSGIRKEFILSIRMACSPRPRTTAKTKESQGQSKGIRVNCFTGQRNDTPWGKKNNEKVEWGR